MPHRPPYLASCGCIIAHGQQCKCQRAKKAASDKQRPSARERGYDSAWDKARKGYLASHPTCVRCGAKATVVDHIKPHRGDKVLFWLKSNWQALCGRCHNAWKQSQEKQP